MCINRYLFRGVIVLGAVCAGLLRVAAAEDDLTYQSLTNLGPCASSRVLLMNNDTNSVCPILGQGYHDTEATAAVGETYWWHDDTPVTEVVTSSGRTPNYYLNLKNGIHHILYQKQSESVSPIKLWELVDCRIGSAARISNNHTFNYLPWSSTCQPIDAGFTAPIPVYYNVNEGYDIISNGTRQVATIVMRAATNENGVATAKIYSPLYTDGIGEIYFDAVNQNKTYSNPYIAVEVAYRLRADAYPDPANAGSFLVETDMDKLDWQRASCDVFKVTKGVSDPELVPMTDVRKIINVSSSAGEDNQYYRIRVPVNRTGAVRFRIVRTTHNTANAYFDYNDLVQVDNIVVSYPVAFAKLTPTGIDSAGEGFARIGRVGAFTEPFLSVGLESAKPRMTYSLDTDGLPSFIDWKVSMTNANFIWRWTYLNQDATSWTTNKMSLAEDESELIGDAPIKVGNNPGDIEYYYVADVSGTHYKLYDFANDDQTAVVLPELESLEQLRYPNTDADSDTTNYWSRIREGVSPWQEMHLIAEVYTNLEMVASITNDWTMSLIGDHTWRGFVWTPPSYTDMVAHVRFVGRNLWETNGVAPVLDSKTWYFPQGEVTEIPMSGVAEDSETQQDIVLDCTAGYLMFEFNDESGAFTMNRAEYQNFNMWTPEFGQKEDHYIGNWANTSYVGRVKQAYDLEIGNWPMARSTSSYWWEDFDVQAGNPDYPFNVPFAQENRKTPNGWTANNAMFINGLFSAKTNTTTYGMALQLKGRGIGSLALIDPKDVPQGIGTVNFSARLAQYYEFGDFYYYGDGTRDRNYAISAKATMTTKKQMFSDVSTGSPSLSLIAYYNPNTKGCYEFRITRVYATDKKNLYNENGVMEIGIYKWVNGNAKLLKSLRYGKNSDADLVPDSKMRSYKNYLVPPDSGTNDEPDKKNWTSVYFGAYTTATTNSGVVSYSTYLEGGLNSTYSTTTDARNDLMSSSVSMISINVTENNADNPFWRGAYGVCSRECPGVFGNIQRHSLTGKGPYKGKTSIFQAGNSSSGTPMADRESTHLGEGDWFSFNPNRMEAWETSGETYNYGVRAAPIAQTLKLKVAKHGTSDWEDSKLNLNLMSYVPTNVVFALHSLDPANVQIVTGGSDSDPRTDVVVDDLQLSQWAANTSSSSDLGSLTKWAYTDAWISGPSTNDNYQGMGGASDSDPAASVEQCGYYVVTNSDTDLVYVFTNTEKIVKFTPKADITVKEVFVLGGGGGGGPGGGGGGGGGALWITNAVDYLAGESGMQIYVGGGGNGGTDRYSNDELTPDVAADGENSYVIMKNPFDQNADVETYLGYGGYGGGTFRDGYDAGRGIDGSSRTSGGSTRKNRSRKNLGNVYGAGGGGAADNGAPGGGGGGGLRGLGSNGSNDPAGTPSNPKSVIYAGTNGWDGVANVQGGNGGDGFPLEVMGDSPIRKVIGDLLGDQDAWLGGGGGGGSGTNTPENVENWGAGAYMPGSAGQGGGGQGGLFTVTWDHYRDDHGVGYDGMMFAGGGGGGGSYRAPVTNNSTVAENVIYGGGKGGCGIVVIHVKIKDRVVWLQPMRGNESEPMSVRTPSLNGISLVAFSWKNANSNAVLHVQVSTNDEAKSSARLRNLTEKLSEGWEDVVTSVTTNAVGGVVITNYNTTIEFKDMDEGFRKSGSTNILIGYRAPIGGVVRILMDTNVVAEARKGSTNNLDSMYGAVAITGMKIFDEPELDDRCWWGWNIMPTYKLEWSSLYDPVTLGPGRSCGLNFSGVESGLPEDDPDYYDPLFADDLAKTNYKKHDPFVQTPRFTNGIGTVSFLARLHDDFTRSGWVTVSACQDPAEENDAKWDVITNIEITTDAKYFRPYTWRLQEVTEKNYQALRLTTFGAAEGRDNVEETSPPQPFGDNGTVNPTPIQRVLLDEVIVTQPMMPQIKLENAYPFRMKMGKKQNETDNCYMTIDNIASEDAQPLLNEQFGFQVLVFPTGMEEDLDAESIVVHLAWYAGETPWGFDNWKELPGAHTNIVLERASDWSVDKLVYLSAANDDSAFVPPQLPGDLGYQIVQYHIWAEYKNKNGIPQVAHRLSSSEWKLPSWYRGIEDRNALNGGVFSAYTVLDSISPKRAWINEINTFDGNLSDKTHQYIEVAVPQGFDMTGWKLEYIKHNDDRYTLRPLAQFGADGVVGSKMKNATSDSKYAFIAIQSPKTKAAGSYSGSEFELDDGTWLATAFNSGDVDVLSPYALRLSRPNNIIEHEVVFMSTNTAAGRSRYTYDGTNFFAKLEKNVPSDWVYAGADPDSGSLGVYTNHGESAECWTNTMQQTPGKVNKLADGTPQFIDPDYFDPPGGTNLWIYANIDANSQSALKMVIGNVTNTTAVIIVQPDVEGNFSTSIVYSVKKWFAIDKVITNEFGKAGGEASFAKQDDIWTLDLSNIKLSNPDSRKFEVMAYARHSSSITNVANGGIAPTDPYYNAVVEWLQNYDEGEIKLAQFLGLDGHVVTNLSLKEMYWLDIPPVSVTSTDKWSDWTFTAGMGGIDASNGVQVIKPWEMYAQDGLKTNIRVAVTLMISNRFEDVAYPPYILRGIEPGSTSTNVPPNSWTSATFKVMGALQNGRVSNVWQPLRRFTIGPESFTNGFTRYIDLSDPFAKNSPGYTYQWWMFPGTPVFYRCDISDDTNRPPVSVQMLNDDTALFIK